MNTYTILNFKTEKKLKMDAQKLAEKLGVPLSTVMNAFLKQFVREKEITFSAHDHQPTPYLEALIADARHEYAISSSPSVDGDALVARLQTL